MDSKSSICDISESFTKDVAEAGDCVVRAGNLVFGILCEDVGMWLRKFLEGGDGAGAKNVGREIFCRSLLLRFDGVDRRLYEIER